MTIDESTTPFDRAAAAAAMAAFGRIAADPGSATVRAAVCFLVVTGPQSELSFVLTRRTSSLRSHKGQWALPGGRLDAGESARDAALRELQEELGVDVGPDRVLGELDDYLTRSGYCITPVVVWAADLDLVFEAGEDEVAEVHVVSLHSIDVDPRFITIPESDQPVIQVPLFDAFIHAPTGAILHQFREVVLHGRPTRVSHFEQPVFAWR